VTNCIGWGRHLSRSTSHIPHATANCAKYNQERILKKTTMSTITFHPPAELVPRMRIDSAFLVDVLSPHVSALSVIYVQYNIFNVVSTLVLTTGIGPLVVWSSVLTL
jgi:hypothetical protein